MKDRNAVKAGLFILITIALVVAVIISISGFDTLLEPTQKRVADFKLADDLGGLKVGDDIRIGGAKVGEVKSIQIDPANDRIHVAFLMPEKYVVHRDAVLRVQGTVTGSSWLNFETLGTSGSLKIGEPIAGQPSQMSQLLASLGDAAPQITQVLNNVRTQTVPRLNTALDTFKTTGQNATHLIQHVDKKVDPVTDNAAAAMASVHDMLGPSTLDFHQTMANLNSASGTIKTKLPGVMDRLHDALAKADTAITKLDGSMNDIKATLANLNKVSGSLRSLIADNRSRLQQMIDSLKATSNNLKFASADIWRSPWRLLYKPTKDEIGNLNLYDSARQFAEGANKLSDAAGAVRDAMNEPQIDRAQMQALLQQLNKTFDNFNTVEQKLWNGVK